MSRKLIVDINRVDDYQQIVLHVSLATNSNIPKHVFLTGDEVDLCKASCDEILGDAFSRAIAEVLIRIIHKDQESQHEHDAFDVNYNVHLKNVSNNILGYLNASLQGDYRFFADNHGVVDSPNGKIHDLIIIRTVQPEIK